MPEAANPALHHREANETNGAGDAGSHNIATTYQMGRDNALEIDQAYNSGEP